MTPKKILFFGTPDIAVPALKKLNTLSEVEIVGVGVFPDKPVGRKQVFTPCPVKTTAQKLKLPIEEILDKQALSDFVQQKEFDLGIVIAFGMIFPEKILEENTFINVHFSLLPAFRGASPVQSAILAGKKESGITFQQMEAKLDSGSILWQKKYSIENKKTSEVFYDFAEKTDLALPEFLEAYFSQTLSPTLQDDSLATYCQKIKKTDGEIFPSTQTAQEIYKKFLAFDIWPQIFLHTSKGNVKLTDISLLSSENTKEIKCAQNTSLFVKRAQIPGKKEMLISEILRGHPNIFQEK